MGKKNPIVSFLLDRSGSMASFKSDVIGGYNQFLSEQKQQDGTCRFVMTLFDSQSIDTEHYEDIQVVPRLTPETFLPRGGTPLRDAIGKTIAKIDSMPKNKRVLFVIYTDGQENQSREFSQDNIKSLIKSHEEKGWTFLFLGADVDAYANAGQFGIPTGQTFRVQGSNTAGTYAAMSNSTSDFRKGADVQMVAASLQVEEDEQAKAEVKPRQKAEEKQESNQT